MLRAPLLLAIGGAAAAAAAEAAAAPAAPPHPHVLFITADDLGYNDLGSANGGRTLTPAIDALRAQGVVLTDYNTFKICAPSRASVLTGRYPWGAGFYDMATDNDHTTVGFTIFPELLRGAGYRTHALGKYDVGFMVRNATATYRGFDDFYGYYQACNADYWFHTAPGPCQPYNVSIQDWSDNAGTTIGPPRPADNGTYNRELLSARARSVIEAHDPSTPMFMYLAFQNVHEGCNAAAPGSVKYGMQAPLAAIERFYNTTQLDTYKVMGGMLSELDDGVADVVDALTARGMLDDTLVVFVSDNGGPLEHSTNAPLRGGKQ